MVQVSHDCDCSDCMETDSRWAPYRETQRALKEDCPKGKHVADLLRATITRDGKRDTAEWWCKHCKVLTDEKGNSLNLKIGVMARVHKKDLTCPCNEHKRYLAKRPPRSNCEDCWRFFVKVNP